LIAVANTPRYKVEKWTRDGQRVLGMLYAGNNLDKAARQSIFSVLVTLITA
jgi:hypothetical protein